MPVTLLELSRSKEHCVSFFPLKSAALQSIVEIEIVKLESGSVFRTTEVRSDVVRIQCNNWAYRGRLKQSL